MHVKRALFLSSFKRAEAWERIPAGALFGLQLYRTQYRFLVEETLGAEMPFHFFVFCVSQVPDTVGRVGNRDVVAEQPHVQVEFKDLGELHTFLHRYEIPVEDGWMPVEKGENQ